MRVRATWCCLLALSSGPLAAQEPSALFGNSYAVVIGIRDYEVPRHWPQLPNGENDARGIADVLASQGFQVKTFIGPQASKTAIVSYLEDELSLRLGPQLGLAIALTVAGVALLLVA